MLAEEGSTLPVYDEATWAQKLSYQTQERGLALALFSSLRAYQQSSRTWYNKGLRSL